MVEAGKSYQPKRRWGANKGPAAKWGMTPFTNPARTDSLVLRHWRRLQPDGGAADAAGDVVMGDAEATAAAAAAAAAAGEGENSNSNNNNNNNQEDAPRLETDYEYARFNVQPEGPEYDDETYEAHLRSEDWSKEETDYLVEMVREYYHRWAVVADRYDFQPPAQPEVEAADAGEEGVVAAPAAAAVVAKPRTMEDMKARYYQISAKLMELKTPIASMTNAEFGLHEVLTRFDPDREKQRKKVAAALLERTADEIKEEQYLLGELQRINTNYEKLSAERDEVRQRLYAPSTQGTTSTAQFQSSHALSQLFNQLLQQDRSKKRNGRLTLNTTAADAMSIPSGQQTPMTAASASHRGDALASAGGASNKRGSIATPSGNNFSQQATGPSSSSAAAQQHHQQSQPPRALNPRAMARLGVTQHERLSSGVSFKSDRLHKLRMAKSTIQTQKIQQALGELRIPDIIALPTPDVCDAFEVLVNKIHKLLDLRKLLEKEETEVGVAESVRRERERRERAERGEPELEEEEEDEEDEEGEDGEMGEGSVDVDDADADGEVDDADADGEVDDGGIMQHQQGANGDGGTAKMEDTDMPDAPAASSTNGDGEAAGADGHRHGAATANGVKEENASPAAEGDGGASSQSQGQKRSASEVSSSAGSGGGKRNRK